MRGNASVRIVCKPGFALTRCGIMFTKTGGAPPRAQLRPKHIEWYESVCSRNEFSGIPRPHQRESWHGFMVLTKEWRDTRSS